MAKHIKIKKGLDIPLAGRAEGSPQADSKTKIYGVIPDDFPGHVWKARVKPGDEVKAGSRLLSDKATDSIALVSPVAGTVKEIIRGERRKIMAVTVERHEGKAADAHADYDLKQDAATIRKTLQESGLWALMRQRPYDIVPAADSEPRDIFITAFDSSPLAPQLIAEGDYDALEKGIAILASLTNGKVYLGLPADSTFESTHAETVNYEGQHPAGNVGVQIAAIRPVNKGETVWTLDARAAVRIGRLWLDGAPDWKATVALTGPECVDPCYITTYAGASATTLLEGHLPADKDIRVISGNVLTGEAIDASSGFLHFPWRQITIIKEGAHADEFMGWASLNPKKYSVKRTFPAFLRGLAKPFPFDARIKGGHRAMILSEEYDNVFPFDIYPEYLIKAIIAGDIDRMEKLGIYEVAPEDFALPEFIDTSKLELQKIVREGIDKLRSEE